MLNGKLIRNRLYKAFLRLLLLTREQLNLGNQVFLGNYRLFQRGLAARKSSQTHEFLLCVGGPEVGDDLSTSVPGVFACGNVLHVHDLVDFVSQEAARAGENAARYLLEHRREGKTVRLTGQNGVRYTVPQYLDPEAMEETVTVRFRVGRPYRDADLAVYLDGRLLRRVHKRILSPGEMEQLTLRRADLPRGLKQITIQVEEGAQ